MQYTEEQKTGIREEFARRRRNQIILAVPLILVILLVAAARGGRGAAFLGLPAAVWGPGFLVFVAACVAYSLYNWRCPACNRYLGRDVSPQFCRKCGVNLR